MKKEELMMLAIRCSEENIAKGGGPFGAVVARNGEVVAMAGNSVTLDNDPTAHAEVNAIRAACKSLGTYDLSECELYTSCEPCPMCLGAIYWARIPHFYYANTRIDAEMIDFDDSFIYDEFSLVIEERSVKAEQLLRNEAIKIFESWKNKIDKTPY